MPPPNPPRIVLVHGVATTALVWRRVEAALAVRGLDDVLAVARPCSGSLETELEFLRPLAEDALVVGQSGGATLALALAASEVRLAGAICHEPAVGSLLPGLLAPVARAFAAGGTAGFGRALYGASWRPSFAGADDEVVGRELRMFRAFEPAAVREGQGPTLVTVGARSPSVRHEAATALHERLGHRIRVLPGAAHFAAWDAPDALAGVIAAVALARRPG